MKKIILFLAIIIIFFGFFGNAYAHNPRIVPDNKLVDIQNPEISQAFYGELKGSPAYFRINSDKSFTLYLQILSPYSSGPRKDFSVIAVKQENGEQIIFLDGKNYNWKYYYEEFGGDSYYMGPEDKKEVGLGIYIIEVSNPQNQGKYTLVFGEKESFPPKEIASAVVLLPQLKSNFFAKSALTAYFNTSGLYLLIMIAIIAGFAFIIYSIVKKVRKPSKNS